MAILIALVISLLAAPAHAGLFHRRRPTPTVTRTRTPTPTPTLTATPTATPTPGDRAVLLLDFGTAHLSNPSVAGEFVNIKWSDLEPTKGSYEWSVIDNAIQPALTLNKQVWLAVTAGAQTPTWVYADVTSVEYESDAQNCALEQVPIPWDENMGNPTGDFQSMIAAVGARYASNPLITGVAITGINTDSGETHLVSPHSACEAANATTWVAAGYTPTVVENTFSTFAQAWSDAFPGRTLFWGTVGQGFPNDTPSSGLIGPVEEGLATELPAVIQFDGWSTTLLNLGQTADQEAKPLGSASSIHTALKAFQAMGGQTVAQLYDADIAIATPADLSDLVSGIPLQ